MQAMKVQVLNHLVMTVSDLDRSRKFYGELLGFDVKEVAFDTGEVKGGFYFNVGEVAIYFISHRATPETDRFSESRIGLDHLAFKATNEAELAAMSERLIAAGVDTKGLETFVTGNKYIAFRDPDNIQLEYWLTD